MSAGIFDLDYIITGFVKHLVWETPYDHDLLTGYQASVSSYNLSLPGDQYRIDLENQTITAILLSNQTSAVTGNQSILDEVTIKPLYANKFLTNSTLYISVEPGVAVLAIEGLAELQGDIIEEDNNPAVFIFAKDGFKISNANFSGFAELYLIASSIHDNFSLGDQQNLTATKLHEYFDLRSFGYLSGNITIDGSFNAPTKLNLFANSFGCNGFVETDNLEVYLNTGNAPASFNCSVNANSLEFTSLIAPIGILASVKATNVTIAITNTFTVSGSIEANNFAADAGNLIVTEQGQIVTTVFNTSEESGNITIDSKIDTNIEGKLYSGSWLNIASGNIVITGELSTIQAVNIDANSIEITNANIKSNDAVNLSYHILQSTNSSITAKEQLALSPRLSKDCATVIDQGSKLVSGKTAVNSFSCHMEVNNSSFITEGNINLNTTRLACNGIIEADNLAIYLNSPDALGTFNCSVNASNFLIFSVTAPLELAANIKAINATIASNSNIKTSGAIAGTDILVKTLGNFTNHGLLTATNQVTLEGCLFENYGKITTNDLSTSSESFYNRGNGSLTVTGTSKLKISNPGEFNKAANSIYVRPLFINVIPVTEHGLEFVSEAEEVILLNYENEDKLLLANEVKFSPNIKSAYFFAKNGFEIRNFTTGALEDVYFIASSFTEYSLDRGILGFDKEAFNNFIFNKALQPIRITSGLSAPNTKVKYFASSAEFKGNLTSKALDGYISEDTVLEPVYLDGAIIKTEEFKLVVPYKAEGFYLQGVIEASGILVKTLGNFANFAVLNATNQIELGGGLFENYATISSKDLIIQSTNLLILNHDQISVTNDYLWIGKDIDGNYVGVWDDNTNIVKAGGKTSFIGKTFSLTKTTEFNGLELDIRAGEAFKFHNSKIKGKTIIKVTDSNLDLGSLIFEDDAEIRTDLSVFFNNYIGFAKDAYLYSYHAHLNPGAILEAGQTILFNLTDTHSQLTINKGSSITTNNLNILNNNNGRISQLNMPSGSVVVHNDAYLSIETINADRAEKAVIETPWSPNPNALKDCPKPKTNIYSTTHDFFPLVQKFNNPKCGYWVSTCADPLILRQKDNSGLHYHPKNCETVIYTFFKWYVARNYNFDAGVSVQYFLDTFKGSDASKFDVTGSAYFDVGQLNVNIANFKIGKYIFTPKDSILNVKNTPITLNKKVYIVDSGAYWVSDAYNDGYDRLLQQMAINLAGISATATQGVSAMYQSPNDKVSSTLDLGTFITGSGKLNIINGEVIVKHGASAALLPQSNLVGNQLVSSLNNNQLVSAYSLNGIDKIIVGATVNPNQPVKPIDMLIFATSDIKESMFSYNHKKTVGKELPPPDTVSPDEIRYLYQRNYQSLYSCEYGIETIIEKLGLDSKKIGLILADQTDQMQLIMKTLTQKTGYSRFAEFEMELAKAIKDGSIPATKENCESIKWLIDNAIEIKSSLKFGELKVDNLHEITKSFLWLVYNHYPIDPTLPISEGNSVKVLEPVVYIPLSAAQNAKSRGGASLSVGGEVNIITAVSNGVINLEDGTTAQAENFANFGTLKKDGGGDVLLKVSGQNIMASAVETTVSLAAPLTKPSLPLGKALCIEESKKSVISAVGHEITAAKLTDPNSHIEVDSKRLTYASIINTGEGIFKIEFANAPVIAGTMIDGGKGGISFDAKKDISFLSAQLFYSTGVCEGDNFHCVRSLQNVFTSMSGNIQINAVDKITLAGVDGKGVKELEVKSASSGIDYIPVYNLYYEETKTTTEKDGGWFGSDKTYISHRKYFLQDPKVDQIGTEAQPAIQIYSESYGDTKISGLIVHSIKYEFKAGTPDHKANINVNPAIKSEYNHQFNQVIKDGLSWSSGKLVTYQEQTITDNKETNTATMPELHSYSGGGKLDARSDIEVKAGKNFMVDHKDGNVVITAQGDININAVSEVVQTTTHEETTRKDSMGFETSFEEVCFATTKSTQHSKSYTITTHTNPVDIKGKVSEIISEGKLNTKGVNVQNAIIRVLEHVDQPAYDTAAHSMDSLYTELKTKTGFINNFAKALDKTMAIADSDGNINKGFAAYAAYASWLRAVANPIKFDIAVSMKVEKEKVSINDMTLVPSVFSGTTDVKSSKMHYIGTEFRGLDATFKGDELIMEAAFSSYEESKDGKCKSITASFASQSVIGKLGNKDHKLEQKNAKNVKVELSGTYSVETTGTTELKGIEVNAANIKINVGSLLVKSIQSIIKKYGDENHLGIGTSFLEGRIKPLLDEIGFMHERGSKLWIDRLTQLIAKDKVEIIVNGMFHIAGAMVANAVTDGNGQYKDGGKLSIKAAEILAENIKGYDNGQLLGASLSLSATDDGIFGNEHGLGAGFKALHQLVKPTIGNGNVEAGKSSGEVSHDLNNPIETSGIKIDPIHAYYQSIDLNKLGESLERRNTFERAFDSVKNIGEQVRSWYYKATGAEDPRKAEALDPKEALRTAGDQLIDEIIDLEEEAKAEEEREEKEAENMEGLLKKKTANKEQNEPNKKSKDTKSSKKAAQKKSGNKVNNEDGTEVIDLNAPKYNEKGYPEPIGPNEPFAEDFNKMKAYIDKIPISEIAKMARKDEAYEVIKELYRMSEEQKAELANAIKEKYSEKSVWDAANKLNPFRVDDAHAIVPIVIAGVIVTPELLIALTALSGATYFTVTNAIKETQAFIGNMPNKGSVFWTPPSGPIGQTLSTPAHKTDVQVEGFPLEQNKGQILITIPEENGHFQKPEDIGFPIQDRDLHIVYEYKIDGKKFQDHHIISDKNKHTEDVRKLWEKAGMNPQSRANKIFLPTEPEYHPTRSIHKGKHWDSVSEELSGKMKDYLDIGARENWSQEQYKDALKNILKEERANLKSGDRALNKNMREWADDKGRK